MNQTDEWCESIVALSEKGISVSGMFSLSTRAFRQNGNPVPFSRRFPPVCIFLCFAACLDFPRQAAFRQADPRQKPGVAYSEGMTTLIIKKGQLSYFFLKDVID